MAYFDRLNPVSFAGFAFPVRTLSLKGSLRHHVHEYPYAPGGAVERLGRKLYEVRVTTPFHETFAKWPKLLETAATLRTLFEGGKAWDLNIPHVGVISATCIEWQDDLIAKARSGYDSQFTFLEDQSQAFLTDKLVTTSVEVQTAIDALKLAVASRSTTELYKDFEPPAKAKALAEEDAAFDTLFAVMDLLDGDDLYTDIVAQKAANAEAMCAEMRTKVHSLNEWPSYALLDSLSGAWAAMRTLARDALKREAPIDSFVTAALLDVGAIATRLYGSTARAVELLRLNAFDDALAVPAGTVVRYYVGGEAGAAAA